MASSSIPFGRIFGAGILLFGAALSQCVGDSNTQNDAGHDATADVAMPQDGSPMSDAPTEAETGPCSTCDGGCYGGVCGGNAVIQVAAGWTSSCVVLADGEAWCWGDDQFGEVGIDPTTLGSSQICTTYNGGNKPCVTTPTRVAGLPPVTAISVGYVTCAIDRSQNVWCWGDNDSSQLGHVTGSNGDTNGIHPAPIQVVGLSSVVQVSTSLWSVCARTASGDVYCWGTQTNGAQGNGNTSGPDVTAPTKVLSGISDISVGLNALTVCALKTGGEVDCWGWNTLGAAGHTPNTNGDVPCVGSPVDECNGTPTAVQGLVTGAQVAAGQQGACALLTAKTVSCWGYLPENDKVNGRFPPLDMGLTSISSLSMRTGEEACAIGAAGVASCWGDNYAGQLGLGFVQGFDAGAAPCHNATSQACYDQPQTIPALHFLQISAGGSFVLALGADGKAYGWGTNEFGQSGHPPATDGDTICKSIYDTGSGRPCNPTPVVVNGLP